MSTDTDTCRARYNSPYTMMAKPIKTPELHYLNYLVFDNDYYALIIYSLLWGVGTGDYPLSKNCSRLPLGGGEGEVVVCHFRQNTELSLNKIFIY